MPPLLKSLSTCATNPIRNLVLLSKSEWFSGLGTGLSEIPIDYKMRNDYSIKLRQREYQ